VEEDVVAAGVEHRADRGEGGAELRVNGGIDDVGGRSDAEPQPQRSTLDLRDDGDRQGPDRLEDGGEDLGQESVGVIGVDVGVRDVATGAEDLALTADEEPAHTRNRLGALGHGRGDITEAIRVERIAGLRPIEDDLGDLAAAAQLDLGHGCSCAAGHARSRPAGTRSGGMSPSVEALPGFSADLTGLDLVAPDLRRGEAGPELVFDMLDYAH